MAQDARRLDGQRVPSRRVKTNRGVLTIRTSLSLLSLQSCAVLLSARPLFEGARIKRPMSRTNRNFVIAYVLLVGFPLLGLLTILRNGERLAAPVSLEGVWKVESNLAELPCSSTLRLQNASLRVSQSGKQLLFSVEESPRGQALGSLEGRMVRASLQPSAFAADDSCADDRTLTLIASVDSHADANTLTGILSVDGCGSCRPAEFHAVRQGATQREAR